MHTTEDFRKQKAERIAEAIKQGALVLVKIMTDLAKHTRKKPRIVSGRINHRNRQLYRNKHGILLAKIAIHGYMTRCQLQIILSQPIPKFKPGGVNTNETEAIWNPDSQVSERGKEYFINPFVSNPHAIQPLPSRQRDNL